MNWLRLKRSGTIVVLFGCCSLTVFLSAGMAWASGESGHSMWPDFFYRLLNFTIMVAVLVFIFKKLNLKSYFTKRTETISNTLRDLEEKKKEAEKTYEEYKQKLARLDEETDRILKEYIEQGEREKAKIIANAEKAAAEIRKQTDIAIEQEIKSAKEGLQREIAELSVTAAETLLKEKIGDADQTKLVDDFMTKVVEAK
ncbi:MAG: ATP synthase F0 subunit B [Deltaproteobacteria bacterium]|jgi:F-type H+-transporting ATPase subunit b